MKAIFIINNSNSFIIITYFLQYCAHPDNEQIKTQLFISIHIFIIFIIKFYLGDKNDDVKSSIIG